MNLANLKSLCAAYHLKATSDLTINGIDLFLAAANNAARNAQLNHNFEDTRVSATLDIDGITGGALSDAVIAGTPTDQLTVTGTLVPDATGTYSRLGTWNSQPAYYITGFFLFFDSVTGFFTITQTLADNQSASWTGSATSITGSYTPNDVFTGTATVTRLTSAASFSSIKEVVAVQRSNVDGSRVPLDFTRADVPIERDRTSRELDDYYSPRERYPSDADVLNLGDNTTLYQRGGTIFLYPKPIVTPTDPLSVVLEAYAWLSKYTTLGTVNDDPQDFLLEYGSEYMQWAIIIELNYRFQTFVPRQEGVLSPPQQAMQVAWNNLLAYDAYRVNSNATRSR